MTSCHKSGKPDLFNVVNPYDLTVNIVSKSVSKSWYNYEQFRWPHKLAPLMFLTSCASSLGPCFVTPPTSSLSWEWLLTRVVRMAVLSWLSTVWILLGRPPLSACAGSLSTSVDLLPHVVGCLPLCVGSHLGSNPFSRVTKTPSMSSPSSSHPLAQSQISHYFGHYSLLGFVTKNIQKVFVVKLKTKG